MTLITKPKPTLLLLFICCWNFILGQTHSYVPNQVLIKLKPNRTAHEKIMLQSRISAKSLKQFPRLNIELWEIEETENCVEDLIKTYSNHPDVAFIEPNYYVKTNAIFPDDPGIIDQWNLDNTGQSLGLPDADIDAPEAWTITTGAPSVIVAIIDTGIDWTHEDLVDNIWQNLGEDADNDGRVLEFIDGNWVFDPDDINGFDDDGNGYADDFVGWDFFNNTNTPTDLDPHGTHVAGIVGARGDNATGVSGVCWEVNLAALKFIQNNVGVISDAVEALNYALMMDMPVSNNSWGGGLFSQALVDAIQVAADSNHLFVAAAGNGDLSNGLGVDIDFQLQYPAAYSFSNIISVAATNRNDRLRFNSNFGTTNVDLGAPGEEILGCFPGNAYDDLSGTSMAAPHIAAACAMLWEINPNKTATQIKEAILSTVDPIDALQGRSLSGGRLNLYKALRYFENSNCSEQDSLALVALYNATNGSSWVNSWNLNNNMNTWHGVGVNAAGCVTELALSGNFLSGTLPIEIGDLQSLTTLVLNFNTLSSPLPTELAILPNLTTVELSGNQLNFGGLESLRGLDLMQLTYVPQDSIPTNVLGNTLFVDAGGTPSNNTYQWFRNNTLIETNIGDNTFTATASGAYRCVISNSIVTNSDNFDQNLTLNSKTVYIYPTANCRTRDSLILVDLYNATNTPGWSTDWNLNQALTNWEGVVLDGNGCVATLNLSNNNLTGTLPESILNLSELDQLNLSQNNLEGNIHNNIDAFSNLTLLWLGDNNFTGMLPDNLGNLNNLTSLGLSACNFSGSIPQNIATLPNLNELWLDLNSFTFSGLEILPTLGLNNLIYANQDSIETLIGPSCLLVEAGGTMANNNYNWYKDGVLESTIEGNNIFVPNTSGWYRCEVTNDLVTVPSNANQNLILYSRNIYFQTELVYPGDFNFDGVVDNDDLPFWGLAVDSTGPARINPTINWEGQNADSWSNTIFNTNGKHQDGNGDGIVNETDLQAFNFNYGNTHTSAPPIIAANSDRDQYEIVRLSSDTAGILRYAIVLNESTPPSTIHGFSTKVYLGSLRVRDARINVSNSCLNPEKYTYKYDPAENRLDIALTRTDKNNVICIGEVVTFIVITDKVVGNDPILFRLIGGLTIVAGDDADTADSTYTIDNTNHTSVYSEVSPSSSFIRLSANLMPERCDALGEFEVMIEGGIAPYTINWSTGESSTIPIQETTMYKASIGNLIRGAYAATVTDAQDLSETITVDIEGPLLDCNTNCPTVITLANAIPENTYQANTLLQSSAIIESGKNIIFKAGFNILLEAGFEVEPGAAFEANIEACEN